jgi:type II secretory pathway pseudopilin PulG
MNARVIRGRRRGFTLIEMSLAGLMMVLVATLLAQAWATFGRPAISAVARARLAQEANLAAEALARDVGWLARPGGPQTDSRYQNVQPDGSTLYMTIDDGGGAVRTIFYSIDENDPGKLFRNDSGNKRVVATLVDGFTCENAVLPVGADDAAVPGVRIDLTLRHRAYDRDRNGTFRGDHTRRYSLFIPDPQP